MSVYEDEAAHKIYPLLDPTAPPSLDPQPYQLAKVSKIEKLLPLWDRSALPAGHENEAIQHHYICSWHWSCHHDNRNWRYFNFKLDNISNAISQTMQDENTSTQEFHKILQETEKYRQLKAEVRTTAKRKVSYLLCIINCLFNLFHFHTVPTCYIQILSSCSSIDLVLIITLFYGISMPTNGI